MTTILAGKGVKTQKVGIGIASPTLMAVARNLALSRLLDSSSRRSKRIRSMWKDVVEPSEQICWRLSFPVNTDNSDNGPSNPTYWLSSLDEISETAQTLLTNALLE
ncbi:hypothetical protein GJ496_003952 [Pomphorhynchus laevis]|nr:hypothetical protein GJ496_003952 [Pomphorhynchus laevis]